MDNTRTWRLRAIQILSGVSLFLLSSAGISLLDGCDVVDPASCLIVTPTSGTSVGYPGHNLTGEVKNNCGRHFDNVNVVYKFYDESGKVVGSDVGLVSGGLENGETGQFRVLCYCYWQRYKVTEIKPW